MSDLKTIEQALADLRKENEALKKRLEKCEAVTEISNLIAHYYRHHINNPNEKLNKFNAYELWAKRDDSSVEVADFGLFVGYDNVKAFFEASRPSSERGGYQPGFMFEHDLCSAQIVIADDGETARGVWSSPGHETFIMRKNGEIVHKEPQWAWGRIACDFIKENGEWKIWHYHWYRLFRCPFNTAWTDFTLGQPPFKLTPEDYAKVGGNPEKILPTSYHKMYSTDEFLDAIPPTPQPYATWTDDRFPV